MRTQFQIAIVEKTQARESEEARKLDRVGRGAKKNKIVPVCDEVWGRAREEFMHNCQLVRSKWNKHGHRSTKQHDSHRTIYVFILQLFLSFHFIRMLVFFFNLPELYALRVLNRSITILSSTCAAVRGRECFHITIIEVRSMYIFGVWICNPLVFFEKAMKSTEQDQAQARNEKATFSIFLLLLTFAFSLLLYFAFSLTHFGTPETEFLLFFFLSILSFYPVCLSIFFLSLFAPFSLSIFSFSFYVK